MMDAHRLAPFEPVVAELERLLGEQNVDPSAVISAEVIGPGQLKIRGFVERGPDPEWIPCLVYGEELVNDRYKGRIRLFVSELMRERALVAKTRESRHDQS
jgi:hypothetical protein